MKLRDKPPLATGELPPKPITPTEDLARIAALEQRCRETKAAYMDLNEETKQSKAACHQLHTYIQVMSEPDLFDGERKEEASE